MANGPSSGSLGAIATLLGDTTARPVVRSALATTSPLYDVDYRMFVNSIAFEMHANLSPAGLRIQRARIKLLQFVAIRPWLLPALQRWSTEGAADQFSLEHAQRIRRAFLTDTIHDAAISFLIAHEALEPSGSHLLAGRRYDVIASRVAIAKREGLFARERATLELSKEVRITIRMLEGR
jgi:hypothetical protein